MGETTQLPIKNPLAPLSRKGLIEPLLIFSSSLFTLSLTRSSSCSVFARAIIVLSQRLFYFLFPPSLSLSFYFYSHQLNVSALHVYLNERLSDEPIYITIFFTRHYYIYLSIQAQIHTHRLTALELNVHTCISPFADGYHFAGRGPKGQHSAPRGGPPRSWTNDDLTKALENVWNKRMTTSQASRVFGIPYNSLLMYVRGKYGKSLRLDVLKKNTPAANDNLNTIGNSRSTPKEKAIKKEEREAKKARKASQSHDPGPLGLFPFEPPGLNPFNNGLLPFPPGLPEPLGLLGLAGLPPGKETLSIFFLHLVKSQNICPSTLQNIGFGQAGCRQQSSAICHFQPCIFRPQPTRESRT